MQNQTEKIIAWLGLADNDYIAARSLLRQGLLVQGTILACFAIEKYFKTVHLIENKEFKKQGEKAHDVLGLYAQLKKFAPRQNLNESYLATLNKAYKLRYPDKLEKEFNIALHQAKTLVGLDETVFKIRNRVKIVRANRPFKFEQLIEQKNEQLLQGNHTFGDAKRDELFQQPLLWYEMRVLKNETWMEANYVATAKDDGKYDVQGFRHGSSNKEFKLQAAPIGQDNEQQCL